MDSRCECGAPLECLPVWHAALAAEQTDRAMGVWHNPLVCAFILQHRSMFRAQHGGMQLSFLRLFLDQGIDAVNAAARQATARNRGSRPGLAVADLRDADGCCAVGFPESFRVSVHHLYEHLHQGEGFVSSGHAAYGARMRDFAEATVDAWAARGGPGTSERAARRNTRGR